MVKRILQGQKNDSQIVSVSPNALQSDKTESKSMDAIESLLTRGVDTIYPNKSALEAVLRSGKKLTLYQGFDPTGTQLHIGHAVGFRKLRQFQDLGHHVIFLIGDGTGLAGDPSGKMKARGRFMSREELRHNAREYIMQAGKIVRFEGDNPIEIRYNGDWLTKLTLEDILTIAQHFSLQQMIERDMYQVRMKAGDTVNLREFMYPLLQGYDSVAMNVDLEIGGTDQMFNMLAGRTLVRAMQNREKFVVTTPLLTDSQGNKIGKTEGNVIGLTDPPSDFYAKIMSLGDDAIIPCFTLLTDIPISDITGIKEKIRGGENPMTFKKQLAFHLTSWLNSDKDAVKAQAEWESVHQKGEIPSESLSHVNVSIAEWASEDLVVAVTQNISKSEAKRLTEQHAVELNGKTLTKGERVTVKNDDIMKIGKRTYVKITLSA